MMKQVSLFKVLGDETRLMIIDYIHKNKKSTCCQIAEHLKKDVSTTFRHIEALKYAGIIETRKDGKFLECKIKDEKLVRELFELAGRFKNAPNQNT